MCAFFVCLFLISTIPARSQDNGEEDKTGKGRILFSHQGAACLHLPGNSLGVRESSSAFWELRKFFSRGALTSSFYISRSALSGEGRGEGQSCNCSLKPPWLQSHHLAAPAPTQVKGKSFDVVRKRKMCTWRTVGDTLLTGSQESSLFF